MTEVVEDDGNPIYPVTRSARPEPLVVLVGKAPEFLLAVEPLEHHEEPLGLGDEYRRSSSACRMSTDVRTWRAKCSVDCLSTASTSASTVTTRGWEKLAEGQPCVK